MRSNNTVKFLPNFTEKYNTYQLWFDIKTDTPNILVVFSDKSEKIFPNGSSYQDSDLYLSVDKDLPAMCTLYLNSEYTFTGLKYIGEAYTNSYLEIIFEVEYEL